MPKNPQLCQALVMSGNDYERCLTPVAHPSKRCCAVHLPQLDASYHEYKAAGSRADQLRAVYAQKRCSEVARLDPALVEFYGNGVRDYIDAVELELRLRREHDMRFYLVVDEGHQQRLEKLERDLAHGRRLMTILETRRVLKTASAAAGRSTRTKGRLGGISSMTNSPVPRVVQRCSRKKSKSTSKPKSRRAKAKAQRTPQEKRPVEKRPDHEQNALLSEHEGEMEGAHDVELDHHEEAAVGQPREIGPAQSVACWGRSDALDGMLDAKGKDELVWVPPKPPSIFEDGIVEVSNTICPDAILADVNNTLELPQPCLHNNPTSDDDLRPDDDLYPDDDLEADGDLKLDDACSAHRLSPAPEPAPYTELAAENIHGPTPLLSCPPRLPDFVLNQPVLFRESGALTHSSAVVLKAQSATMSVGLDESEREGGQSSSTIMPYTRAERVDACVPDGLGVYRRALQSPHRPQDAYTASSETIVDLRGSTMSGFEEVAAPTRPLACSHDGSNYGSTINSHSSPELALNVGMDNREVDERGDDDEQRVGRRWEYWSVFGVGGLVLLVGIPYLAFRRWIIASPQGYGPMSVC
ncbi:hypothetical protein GY45DRAFT_1321916 [Cubamyces sp. BRFM 1775]|nr:hypothetical protein GY45DRAFT_1321916 [Cubamyces sp. BRFM 1775]